MTSTVDDFKRRARKIVDLPSGLQVEIRKIQLIDFIDIGELPLPSSEENTTADHVAPIARSMLSNEEIHQYSDRTIVSGAVRPKFTDRDEDEDRPDRVHVRDLDQADFTFLVKEILKWSGIRKEVAAAADSFCPDTIGENGGRSGPALSQAASGDSGNVPGSVLSESRDRVPGVDPTKET